MNITSPFGMRDYPLDPKIQQFHTGIDYVEEDHIVKCFVGGIVRRSRWGNNGEGIYVQVMTNFKEVNLFSNYLHCAELKINENAVARKGQYIAIQGSTGNSTGLHTHFEIFCMIYVYDLWKRNTGLIIKNHIVGNRVFFDPEDFLEKTKGIV